MRNIVALTDIVFRRKISLVKLISSLAKTHFTIYWVLFVLALLQIFVYKFLVDCKVISRHINPHICNYSVYLPLNWLTLKIEVDQFSGEVLVSDIVICLRFWYYTILKQEDQEKLF